MNNKQHLRRIGFVLAGVSGRLVAAQAANPIADPICTVLAGILNALRAIGPALVALMLIYGGVRYIYSADDPGGRKQAKSLLINAIIGGIILVVVYSMWLLLFNVASLCQGI